MKAIRQLIQKSEKSSNRSLESLRHLMFLFLLCGSIGVWAEDYVIYDNGHFFAHGTGTNITSPTTFSASSCVWTTSGSTYLKNGSYGINSDAENPPSISIVNGNGVAWTVSGNHFGYMSGSRFYYLNNYNNGWTTARSGRNVGITSLPELLYAVSQQEASLTAPTITGEEYISTTGNHDYSASATSSQTCYKFTGKTTYYGVEGGTLSETAPIGTVSYSWNITPNDYATINTSNGRINVTSIPNQDTQVTITVTASSGGLSEQSSKTITLTKSAPVAAGYVFYSGGDNGNYLNSGTTGTTSFNPNTCLWTGTSGGTFKNNAGYYLYRNNNNNGTFSVSNRNNANCTLDGTESGTTGQRLRVGTNNNGWLRFNNNAWSTANTTANVVFAVTELTYNGTDNTTTPTITAAINSTNTGIQLSHTNVSGTYQPAYTDYVFYNGNHHYWYDGSSHTSAPTAVNFSTTNATYTWSTESEEVTIDAATGLLTSNGNNTSELTTIPVRLTITHAASGYSKTVDYEVKLQDFAEQTASVEIGSHNVIQNVGGELTLQGTLSGTYQPAFTNYVVDGQNHYLYNGTDYGHTVPAINSITDGCTLAWSLSGEGAGYATINTTTGKITYNTDAGHDVVAVANLTVTHPNFPTFSLTADPYPVTLYSSTIAAPTIEVTEGTNKLILQVPSNGTTYFTTDGSDPKTSDTKQTYNPEEPFVLTVSPTTVKAYSERWGVSSEVAVKEIRLKLADPEISISDNGIVTITIENAPDGTELRYTTDGTEPTSESTLYDSSSKPQVGNGATIKVIAVKSGYDSSDVASATFSIETGIVGSTVILNDYEDHNWAYYKGRDIKVGTASDAPNYKDKYKYTLYSPDPRNVKITYRGFNTDDKTIYLGGSDPVATSTLNTNTTPHVSNVEGEGQNTFVFYKTLEKFVIGYFTDSKDWNGIPDDPTKENYPYTVISNPFSVRPSTGSGDSKKYYGFAGWKIIRGGKYIGRGSGGTYTAASDGDVLGLDELIHFVNLDVSYTPNCTSAEVVLEATWAEATVWSGNTAHDFGTTGTYETNFIVASGNIASIEQGTPCTIIGMNPDGTGDNSGSRTITGLKVTTTSTTDPYDRSNCVKVEWIRHGNGTFDANGRNLTMGRGIISSTNAAQGNVYGNNTNGQNVVNTVKVESGYYSGIANINNKTATSANAINAYVIMGCDYDRALANYYVPASEINNNAYNIKLRSSRIYGPNGSPELNRDPGQLYMRALVKSGVFASTTDNEYYFHTYQKPGQRYIEWEGGYNKGHIKGGSDGTQEQAVHRAMTIRMRGGRIDGQFACGSTSYPCYGDRVIAVTGGRIGGWIAPGSNCSSGGSSSDPTRGVTDGTSYIYFGGTAEINSRQFGTSGTDLFYQSTGGVIYGSGLGYSTNNNDNSGQMSKGSNIVLADDAYTERGIYGGGALGQTLTTANIFILGGRVGTGTGQIRDQGASKTYTVEAGVYGGACNRGGENSFIYMDGGVVESGIYGGANINGTMTSNVTMQINGGQVGTDDASANIHGGGYGNSTRVQGSVNLTVGASGATEGVTVYGDVYGGSAEGKTNGNNGLTSGAETNVTLNAGTINGSLYGGGLGTSSYAADVYGPVMVTVNGGTVNTTSIAGSGAVYGCNNVNGTPKSDVTVTINGTNAHTPASGTEGQPGYTPAVYAISEVYGGGNMAHYAPAGSEVCKVIVNNCESSIGYVYGGGNAANVTSTDVTINGGIIGQVFGGGHGNKDASPATEANVNGDVNVLVTGGTINQVFAGSNSKGTIGGSATVKVEKSSATNACEMHVTELYGGGNEADGNAGEIDIISTGDKSKNEGITDVYGGARKANVTSGITLNIKGGNIGRAFGGNNVSGSVSGAIVVNVNEISDGALNINSVYGGGNQAAYTGSPEVNILNGTINQNVFGGGLGASAIVTGNPEVVIGDWNENHSVVIGLVSADEGCVYGGGDAAQVIGTPTVVINDCGTKIFHDVYGGGNAAQTGTTTVTVWGGEIDRVFGGGHGYPETGIGADVDGNTNVSVYGGTIGGVFGASNSVGNITGETNVYIADDEVPSDAPESWSKCPFNVGEIYGAGNEAFMEGKAKMTIGCLETKLDVIYGGAKNAPIYNDIELNITSGTYGKVFGGNCNGGKIYGSITVNIKEDGCYRINIDELYGCGNLAEYRTKWNDDNVHDASKKNDPQVNIYSCEHIGKVFGGGYGADAKVYANPQVNVNMVNIGKHHVNASVTDWPTKGTIDEIYGGGNEAKVIGNTTVNIFDGTIDKYVFGGGNKADVEGDTNVNVGTANASETNAGVINITGNVYGGGNAADVTGKTNVVVGQPKTTPVTP